jgi:hypothetical protein
MFESDFEQIPVGVDVVDRFEIVVFSNRHNVYLERG